MSQSYNVCSLSDDPYRIINLVFIVVLAGIFVYSAIYSPGDHYPVSSNQPLVGIKNSESTGLSRGFSCIVRMDFDRARDFNQYSIRAFLFFFLQFIMRVSVWIILSIRNLISRKYLLIPDISVSLVLFLYCFWPFIQETFVPFIQAVFS